MRTAAAAHVEVGERELFRALHRVRCRHRVEAVEVVRVTSGRLARHELWRRRHDRGSRRDEPRLACVRVEPRLKEGLARERFVRHRSEDPVHTRARGGSTDARQKTECAVGAARLLQRR